MDEVDAANELVDWMLAQRLKAARARLSAPAPGRKCLNCEAELERDGRFCDADCSHDWEKRRAATRRAGGAA